MAEGLSYQRTPRPFAFDRERAEQITRLRRREQEEMRRYGTLASGCRMAFLRAALDDPAPAPCGICDLCAGARLPLASDEVLAREAVRFLRRRPVVIKPRRRWPDGAIPLAERTLEGRALCQWGDGGWSALVKRGKQVVPVALASTGSG